MFVINSVVYVVANREKHFYSSPFSRALQVPDGRDTPCALCPNPLGPGDLL